MPLTDEDKEWFATQMKLSTLEGFNAHRKDDHAPLEEKLDSTRKMVWLGTGGTAVIAAVWEFIISPFTKAATGHGP